jgi:phenylacetate-CoA ligase
MADTWKERFYYQSPIWLQNVLVSAYGARLFYERYFGYQQHRGMLEKSQWMSAEEAAKFNLDMLAKLLTHSYESVPYYRSLFDASGFSPYGFSLSSLEQIPLLAKEVVRAKPDEFISSRYRKSDLIALNTSGTTGKSLRIYVDLDSRRRSYAFTNRFHCWAGLEKGRNNVTLGGRVIVPPQQKENVYWRYNAAMGNYLFSSYHMSDENLPYYIDKMRSIRPDFIEAYPSAAYVLAKFIAEKGGAGIKPKAVLTSGETLFDYQRELIEKVFGCKVFDQYGCTEQALFVSQCEYGSYHVHPEFGLVELLDEQDRPVGPGAVGRVVCTSFVNPAMPLIRYEVGDTAEWGEGCCNCGRSFPVLKAICGRQDDYIITPDGRKIGRLDPVFKGITSVKEAQIVQERKDFVRLLIVPGEDFCEEDGVTITHEFKKRTGPTISVALELVSAIERTANGKIRSVISKL